MTEALEKKKIDVEMMNKIEEAARQVGAVNGFLTLCCFACEDEHSLAALSDFYDLCDLMQQTAKAALSTLSELQDTRGGDPA